MAIENFVYLTWTGENGKRRRSFAVAEPQYRWSISETISYALCRKNGDGRIDESGRRNQMVTFYKTHSTATVKPATWNPELGELEIVS